MLLTDFQEMMELDEQITKLHHELNGLYAKRSIITELNGIEKLTTNSTIVGHTVRASTSWELDQYELLRAQWQKFGIAIPGFSSLKLKLRRAKAILSAINATPDLQGGFEVFLAPPTSKISFPLSAEVRARQDVTHYPDFVSASLPKIKAQKNWKLYVVYKNSEGLPVADYQSFMGNEQYILHGFSMSGLNAREYALYSLLLSIPIDAFSWSLLPAVNLSAEDGVACVGFVDGQYRFIVDETSGVLGENSFRPAMEIK